MYVSELARRVNMSKSALSRYFNKIREFPLSRVEDFARALGVSSEYILGFEEDILIEKTVTTMKKIDDEKKQKVYDFAQKQLEIQTNERITSISKTDDEEIYTLAAHSPDPNREYSEEDIEHIQSVLAKYRKKYEDKNKK
ncbi:helix-turn-helix domain-containing protein [Enterococcus hirae]|uniref:helix-turn-helix domain-containing protein n=1 Tax=Enterococcus hirae TaxID=1354 RepID=UPI00241839F3|nr:helix-turn-helix transcriptional regulator [Enterococcus hirae]